MDYFKYYTEGRASRNDVWRRLETSGKFGWSWCKETNEPFRHTAIVLYFDKVPRFTINLRAIDGSSKASAAFSECESEITIESVKPNDGNTKFFDPLDEFPVIDRRGNQRAKDIIESMLSCHPGNYNLFFNNCRDHVKYVVKRFAGKILRDSDFEEQMAQVRGEDALRIFGAGAVAIAGIGLVVGGLASIFGSTEDEEEERVPA